MRLREDGIYLYDILIEEKRSRRQPEGPQGRAVWEIDELEKGRMIHTCEGVMKKCIIYIPT